MTGIRRPTRIRQLAARRSSKGFTLLSALFLLVVVGGLGGYLVNLASTQHLSSALAVQQSRAYYAALSGLEWVAYQIEQDASDPPNCPSSPTTFTAEGFDVSCACSRSLSSVAGDPQYAMFDITVEATRGELGEWDFVRRTLRATVSE